MPSVDFSLMSHESTGVCEALCILAVGVCTLVWSLVSIHVFIPLANTTKCDILPFAILVDAAEFVATVSRDWRRSSDGCSIACLEMQLRRLTRGRCLHCWSGESWFGRVGGCQDDVIRRARRLGCRSIGHTVLEGEVRMMVLFYARRKDKASR